MERYSGRETDTAKGCKMKGKNIMITNNIYNDNFLKSESILN